MKLFLVSVFLPLFLLFSMPALAQQLKENEIVVIQGEKYVLHQVRTGETIFSISRDFKITQSQLVESNPEISKGLDIGQILKVPFNPEANIQNIPVYQKGDPTGFTTHTIKSRKETPYFIAKEYGVTVEEIYTYNPGVNRFKRGTEIKIPKWDLAVLEDEQDENNIENQTGENNELLEHVVVSGETLYSIAKKYQVSESEILFQNPEARNLKAGSKIYIPVKSVENQNSLSDFEEMAGGNYFEHIIESGETMWGITHKFNVTPEELTALNPLLNDAFPAGAIIRIPMRETNSAKVTAVNPDAFIDHFVEKGETLYGLARKYEISIPDIKKFNPVLVNRNPIAGEMILIPKKQQVDTDLNDVITDNEVIEPEPVIPDSFYKVDLTVEIPESCVPNEPGIFNNSSYNVALFLPLFLEANDTLNRETVMLALDSIKLANNEILVDTLIEQEEPKELFKQFYGNSENFLQFYEGVLIATDSMQKKGMNINLSVFDTQNNPDSIRKFIYTDDFLNTDLIIGPVYENVQKEVSRIAEYSSIPMVSPFSSRSDIINENAFFYQLNPGRNYMVRKTAEMVVDEYFNSNFIVLKTSEYDGTAEADLVNLIREKLFNSGFMNQSYGSRFTVYDFKNEGSFGLRRIMSPDKENVVLIPSTNEGELSIAISNVNNLADDYSITLIGTSNYQQRYPSIDVEHFHNLKLKYVYPYWTNYDDPSTIRFIEKFRENFITEPNNFGMQGFDAAYYFLNALYYYGKDFKDCLPYLHVPLVQGNYHFEKISENGGYMNKGVSVISYYPDYSVTRERVIGQPKLVAEK